MSLPAPNRRRPARGRRHTSPYPSTKGGHDPGDIRFGETLQIEEHHRAGVLGQSHQRLLDILGDEVPEPVQVEIPEQPDVVGRSLGVGVDRVEPSDRRIVPAPAIHADVRVAQDPEQPGLQVRPRSELIRRTQRPDVGLLD